MFGTEPGQREAARPPRPPPTPDPAGSSPGAGSGGEEAPPLRSVRPGFRSGFVTLAGLPNVGKSTLANALVGRKLSIVTPKAQTTRQRLLGIYSDRGHQAVFVDTPGLLEPRYLLQESMREEAERALHEADLLVYVVDAGFGASVSHAREFRRPGEVPLLFCLNKVDRCAGPEAEVVAAELAAPSGAEVFRTVATAGTGVDELREAILARLPEGPPYFPLDDVAAAPVRFFVAELIRETCLEELAQEVPYATAVRVEEFREAEQPTFISATILVERESQKGIVIGRGGRMIRRIGTRSREKVEEFLGRPVHLKLWVKVLRNWRRRKGSLNLLGYRLGT